MSRNGLRQRGHVACSVLLWCCSVLFGAVRYRLPTTSGHGSTWFQQSQEAAAKQAQQDFENAWKTVDAPRSRAAMANKTLHGKATAKQMKALEDALRGDGDGDGSIKAPWELENCPPWKCPGDKTKGCGCKKGGASGKSSEISCQEFRCASLSLLRGCIFLSVARARSLSLCLQQESSRVADKPRAARDTVRALQEGGDRG
jgi:hypothetical protein